MGVLIIWQNHGSNVAVSDMLPPVYFACCAKVAEEGGLGVAPSIGHIIATNLSLQCIAPILFCMIMLSPKLWWQVDSVGTCNSL